MTGLGLKLPHGPHRRPMGGFAAFPSPETSSEARATMARCPRRVQRDSLGAAHRRSLARSARPLSALSNLPSPLPAVAPRRDLDATLAPPFPRCLAGRNGRGSGLRQRPLGPQTGARAPHSHERAQPPQPPESDPGRSRVAPLLSSLENRTPFRLAA